MGGILGDNLGEGNCESKIASRQWGDKFFAARHQSVSQGPLGGFQTRGFPIWTCPSFLVLFRPFWDFPDFAGIFPICSGMDRGFSRSVLLLFSRPAANSTYEEQSRKRPRHNPDLSRKEWGTSGKSKGGLSKGGLGLKGANLPRKGPISQEGFPPNFL